jgi:hypothetical protein
MFSITFTLGRACQSLRENRYETLPLNRTVSSDTPQRTTRWAYQYGSTLPTDDPDHSEDRHPPQIIAGQI